MSKTLWMQGSPGTKSKGSTRGNPTWAESALSGFRSTQHIPLTEIVDAVLRDCLGKCQCFCNTDKKNNKKHWCFFSIQKTFLKRGQNTHHKMDILACDWEGKAGACWECWKCEPCCGEPCNPMDGLYCCVCWYFCGCFTGCKLYAYSMDQDCACVNHILPFFVDYFTGIAFTSIIMRHNLRVKYGRPPPAGDFTGIVGDCLCIYCCGPCAACQMCRSADKDSWDFVKELGSKGFKVSIAPCVLCRAG